MTKYIMKVEQDASPIPPDEWGDDGCFFVSKIKTDLPKGCSDDPDDYDREEYALWPVWAYIHSGIALSLSDDGYPFNCPWDSGWGGFVVVKRSLVTEASPEWREKYHEGKTDDHILFEIAKGKIDQWNTYLSGDIWGYRIYEVEVCNLGHEHETEVDSLWGIYGHDEAERQGNEALQQLIENDKKEAESKQEEANV